MTVNPSETWQEALERWIDASSLRRVAKYLGYSPATLSMFRRGVYPGDSEYVQQIIEERLVGKECHLEKALGSGRKHQDSLPKKSVRHIPKKAKKSIYDATEANDLVSRQTEEQVQYNLASREGGQMEAACEGGRVDLLTSSEVIEIKHCRHWKEATKVLIYAQYFPSHKPRIHLYGNSLMAYETQRMITQGCQELGIRVTWEDPFLLFTELYEAD